MVNITEIKRRADIRDVWTALGGGKLRGNRGQAFWRKGDGFSISLDVERGLWHDHRDGVGGDVVTLVRTVQQCGFLEAAEWLAAHTGVRVSKWIERQNDADTDWRSDLEAATWWSMAAIILADDALAAAELGDPARYDLTALLARLRLGDAVLVDEYRNWRKRHPQLTAAMTRAGQRSDARVQRRLALWLVRMYGEATA
jgi:hypothetical protein